jgi:hypothetical protein
VGDGENFDCIFGFSVKRYARNTINLSWAKIVLTSVIGTSPTRFHPFYRPLRTLGRVGIHVDLLCFGNLVLELGEGSSPTSDLQVYK